MKLSCLSYNFRSISVELKETLVCTQPEKLKALYKAFKSAFGIEDFLILATCNRTELYVYNSIVDLEKIEVFFRDFSQSDLSFEALDKRMYFEERSALKHLFAVASGSKSQVLGDCQVVHQLKESYNLSNELNELSGGFHQLLHEVFKVNKRVTNETEFKKGQTSVASSSINLMTTLVKSKKSTPILLIGTGQNGKDTLVNLLQAGYRNITICNRTYQKAKDLASLHGLKAERIENLHSLIDENKVIFISVSSDSTIINKSTFDWSKIAYFPKYFLDLCAIPSVDLSIEDNPCHEVYGLSYMIERNEETLNNRKKELIKVDGIIACQVEQYLEQKVIKSLTNEYVKMINSDESVEACDFLSEFMDKNLSSEVCSEERLNFYFEKAKVIAEKYK